MLASGNSMSVTPLSPRGSMWGEEQGLDKVMQPPGSRQACNEGGVRERERERRKNKQNEKNKTKRGGYK